MDQRFLWLREELVLAADLAYLNGWRALPPGRPELAELSRMLRSATFYSHEGRPETFRSVGSVRYKVANLISAHPAYRGQGVRVVDSERDVVADFLRNPIAMHEEALSIRQSLQGLVDLSGPPVTEPARSTREESSTTVSHVASEPVTFADLSLHSESNKFDGPPDPPATREQRMSKMRLDGASLDQIGIEFGVTRERVRQILRDHGGPTVEEVRSAQRARLEAQVLAEMELIDDALRPLLTQRGAVTSSEASELLGIDEFRLVDHWPEDLTHLRIYEVEHVVPYWSDEDCLAAIREAAIYEYPLTAKAYAQLLSVGQITGPSLPRVHQRFGGWVAACDAAGVESGTALRGSYESKWTDEELLAYARDYFLDARWPNSAHKYDEWKRVEAPDGPSGMTLRNRLGTWSAIKRQALAPRHDGK